MGFYDERVLPRLVDVALGGKRFDRLRARVAGSLDGDVLEVGFGTGRNIGHYPRAVRRVLAVDPSMTSRNLAAPRIAERGLPVEYVGLDGERLPLDDGRVDHVLTTWTLCTIPDAAAALAEMRRVLRPGGSLHFLEHGRAASAAVARWQDRLTPLQRRVAGGCHLNRPVDRLVAGSGLTITALDRYTVGPSVFGSMYEGVARREAG